MTASESLRAWAPCLIAAAIVFAWHYLPGDSAPSRPAPPGSFPEGSRVIVTGRVRGCWFPGGHCEWFARGERLIADVHLNGNVRVLRHAGDQLGYWIPDRSIELERAP